jgi:diguanylate cyclase (GGDEF)-like protein
VVAILAAIAAAVTVAFFPFVKNEVAHTRGELMVLTAFAVASVLLLAGARLFLNTGYRPAWAVCPFLAVASIVVVDLATFDASLAAQIFFLFPTLYAATLLPWRGTVLVTAACVLGETIVVFANLPYHDALVDSCYMSVALVTTAALLANGAEHQRRLMVELEHRASRDSLTGLVTRRVFDTAAEAALAETQHGVGTALVLLDIDLFKSINDRFGHPGGDAVLVQLSELLVRSSRRGDVVCRLGGDEMAVLMPECSVEVAQRRAEEMVATVRGHGFALGVGEVVNVSVSAGMAHAPGDAETAESLYAAADAALYQAKRAGRDQVVMTQPPSW